MDDLVLEIPFVRRVIVDSSLTAHYRGYTKEKIALPIFHPAQLGGAPCHHCPGGSFSRGWSERTAEGRYNLELAEGDVVLTAGNDLFACKSIRQLQAELKRAHADGVHIVYMSGFRRGQFAGYKCE